MAKKSKKNRRNLSEKVAQRKNVLEAKPNPFEMKINRQKFETLGRNVKHSKGTPGASRSKAMAKRKETLLPEYKQRNKANKFTDKRLGEYDTNVTPEEKMLARFAAERKRDHVKGNIFNLNDEEELTHFGQSLAEIDKFDDPRSDSEDEDIRLGAEFVKTAHFGGFLTRKEHGDDDKDGTKSRKDLIDDLIAKSKQRKYEKQHERESTLDLTEKLDADWKNIRSLLPPVKKSDVEAPKAPLDDYDFLVRKLKFEQRGKAMDRLKTPEEIAREEKEKLERLEMERLRRMKGGDEDHDSSSQATRKHCSADALDDGFKLAEDKSYWVSYVDGKLENEPTPKNKSASEEGSDKEVDTDDEAEESDEDDGTEEDISDIDESEAEDDDKAKKKEEEDSDEEHASDIDVSEADDEDKVVKHKEVTFKTTGAEHVSKSTPDPETELPFVFSMPSSYEDFLELIERHSVSNQIIIVDRIIKCHNPRLGEGNREKMEAFFPMLLQLVNDAAGLDNPGFELIDGLLPHLYDITQSSPRNCAQCLREVIEEKQEAFHNACSARASHTTAFPGFDTLILFILVSKLFPTSDFQHAVVTPAMLFMGQILVQCTVTRRRDLIGGLFVCSVFLEFQSLSKRFTTEAIRFLSGVYYSALKKDSVQSGAALPSFKSNTPAAHLLELQDNCCNLPLEAKPLSLSEACSNDSLTDQFRLNFLNETFNLLYKYAVLYETKPSYSETFHFFTQNQTNLPTERYPQLLRENVNKFLSQVDKGKLCNRSSLLQAKKLQVLKEVELRYEEYDGSRKHKKAGKETAKIQRLTHLHKREMKGAIREMRKDNQFLAKQQLDDQLESSAQNKRKYQALLHDLASQEGTCKAIERIKKSKR